MRSIGRTVRFRSFLWLACVLCGGDVSTAQQAEVRKPFAEIRVIDDQTGRGVPLVELETVHGVLFVTDNLGRVAFDSPEIFNQELFFYVKSHGYGVNQDGFGYAGVRVTLAPDRPATIRVKRHNLAERMCRLTGQGLFRDSLLLGYDQPVDVAAHPGRVAGQDSVQSVLYNDRVYYFWGDTARLSYPLGLFRTAGATTPIPTADSDSFSVDHGIPYDYFVDPSSQFARAMIPLADRPEGVVWIDGVCVVPDTAGKQRLVCHYSRRKGLAEQLDHGIAMYDDAEDIFRSIAILPNDETWRHPSTHPVAFEEDGKQWLLFGAPTPNVRVPCRLDAVLDPQQYEAFSCEADERNRPKLDPQGKPSWQWQKKQPPTSSAVEQRWIQRGVFAAEHARFVPRSSNDDAEIVVLHNGTVRWNDHRQKWILLAGQAGGKSSYLGEIWYSEADHPIGPFRTAVKVVTHDKQTFYNVCHHPFLDQKGGQFVYFEGTYTNDFSGNPHKTPRYNYNQVMYRLDVDSTELRRAMDGVTRSTSNDAQMPRVIPSKDNTHFVVEGTGAPFRVWGVNYDHDGEGRLLEDYWDEHWPVVVEDFQEIKSLGANVVRVHLQVGKFMDAPDQPNAKQLMKLGELVSLADRLGLYLDITGLGCYHRSDVPDWYEGLEEDARWTVQERFWRAVAEVCRDKSNIFCYDLMNEPIVPSKHEDSWLAGEFGGKHFVQRITRKPGGRQSVEIAEQWVKRLTNAIREIDSDTMITVGVIPWAQVFPGAKPLFYSPEVAQHLDFASVHFYPESGKIDQAVTALKVYDIGKPLVVEEIFPLRCSIDEVEEFIDKSAGICDGWISFYWGQTIAENKQAGTMQGAITASWLEWFVGQ